VDAVQWAAISAVASAIAAAISLFNARTQLKSADARDCLELVKQFGEAQRKANAAKTEDAEREVRELLNLFETAALLFNDKRLGRSSRYIVRHALIEGWVWLETTEGMGQILSEAISGPTTFQQLLRFKQSHSQEIQQLVSKLRQIG
jgi:hypothetical protein